MITSHQPMTTPSEAVAAAAAENSGHQLCGLKKPSSPAPSAISPCLSSSGRGPTRRPVNRR